MKFIGYTFATLAVLVLGALWSAWVLTQLWLWFMVPTFNLPALSLPQAMGLSLIVGFMGRDIEPKKYDQPYVTLLLQMAQRACLKPALVYGVGAVVRLYL